MWPFKPKQKESEPEKKTRSKPYTSKFSGARSNNSALGMFDIGYGGFTNGSTGSINFILRSRLPGWRNTSRLLSIENSYAKRYVNLSVSNVCGSQGITVKPVPLLKSGETHVNLSERLSREFYRYANDPSQFSYDGSMAIDIFQQMIESTRAIDGEAFIRIHGTQFEIINADRLLSSYNRELNNGGWISNAIEHDKTGRVVAYWISDYYPITNSISPEPVRVPANEVLHYFIPQYPNQERGIPDMCGTFQQLADLDAYNRATLVSRKISSSSMGFITSSDSTEEILPEDDQYYEQIEYMNPGEIKELQPGQDITFMNAGVNSSEGITDFTTNMLQSISTGLNISRQVLTGDAFSSFSAAKMALLLSQDTFRTRENLMISTVLMPIYHIWLKSFMLQSGMSFVNYANVSNVICTPMKHESIDALKDAKHQQCLLEMGIVSKAELIRQSGRTPQHVFDEIAKEQNQTINKVNGNDTTQGSVNDQNTKQKNTGDDSNSTTE